MSALITVAQKSFYGKFTAKIYFPMGHFMIFKGQLIYHRAGSVPSGLAC